MLEWICEKIQDAWRIGVALSIGLVSWLLLFYVALLSAIISTVSAAFVSLFSFLLMRRCSEEPESKPMTYNEALAIFQCDQAPSKKAIEWTYKCKAKLYNEYKNLDFYRIRLERLEEAKILLLRHLEN